ncbi:MAG: hypothetical protein EOP84_37045 [Verrucomicrobiaceae bacterium]|nr:MAG: hypothetical protein EOP84_37045 [Verrucomicrobiaceae bacterium]
MKKIAFSLLAALAVTGTSFAGTEVYSSGKDYKTPLPPETCFLDRELQIDVYGAYVDGNGGDHAGTIREHGWGGGIGVNYFFTRNIGVGVDGTWIYAEENRGASNDSGDTIFHNFSGSVIVRFPMDEICLAPYLFAGGGFHVDGDQWASAHAGVGLEYRIVPNKVGLFTDARFTYFGDRYGRGDQNNIMVKAGVRFVF